MLNLLPSVAVAQLTYEARDLLKVTRDIGWIAHQVNSIGAIGGLNRAVCNKVPGNEEAIRVALVDGMLAMGRTVLRIGDNHIVANMVAQVFPDTPRHSSDDYGIRRAALLSALQSTAEAAANEGATVFVPFNLACGLAGDKWCNIEPLILEASRVTPFVICVPNWAEQHARLEGYLPTQDKLTLK